MIYRDQNLQIIGIFALKKIGFICFKIYRLSIGISKFSIENRQVV